MAQSLFLESDRIGSKGWKKEENSSLSAGAWSAADSHTSSAERIEPVGGMPPLSSEPALNFIRKRILDGTHPPGSFLSSKSLAKELGLSRTPVRDALRMLETQGLVEITPRLGARVLELNAEEVEDLIGLRSTLEAYCAYLAAQRRSMLDLKILDEAQARMEEIADHPFKEETYPEEIKKMARHDFAFHWQITQATKSRLVIRNIENSRALMMVFCQSPKSPIIPPKPSRDIRAIVCERHSAILDAIRYQNPPAARRAMEAHLFANE